MLEKILCSVCVDGDYQLASYSKHIPGQIPSDWKQARVAPVFKKGDRGQPANYRPISLTCRFDEVEEFFVVWSGFIFTEHGVNVVVICLSAFALDNLF
jgi:hypothetical protein